MAASQVPELGRIMAFRNILIHGYATVDDALVWQLLVDKLPGLRQALNKLLDHSKRITASSSKFCRLLDGVVINDTNLFNTQPLPPLPRQARRTNNRMKDSAGKYRGVTDLPPSHSVPMSARSLQILFEWLP